MDTSKFTQKAQQSLQAAQDHAVRFGHQEVDNEHLLLALVQQDGGLIPSLLGRMDVDLEAMVGESHYGRLAELDLPCTVVVGSKDKTTPPFHTADLHAGISGSKLVSIPRMGHLLNWESPDALVDEIEELANRVPQRGG